MAIPAQAIDRDRIEKMRLLHADGKTLAEIGGAFQISRERVRQLLSSVGVTSDAGGLRVRVARNRAARAKLRSDRLVPAYGCTRAALEAITRTKFPRDSVHVQGFIRQRANAQFRGEAWELSLPEWMAAWKKSGRIGRRGRGRDSFVLTRMDARLPWRAGNVHVVPFVTACGGRRNRTGGAAYA